MNLATGPDGALYVVDFYRKWVEHPQWVANEEARKNTDWDAGKEYGRIYRVRAKGDAEIQKTTNLALLSPNDLLPFLGHRNAWYRETAQRLLLEASSIDTVPGLLNLATSTRNELSQIHAIAVLNGMNQLEQVDGNVLTKVFKRCSLPVLRTAVPMSEKYLANDAALSRAVSVHWKSEDASVRFRVALASSYLAKSAESSQTLVAIFMRDNDPWMRQALFTACGGRVRDFIGALVTSHLTLEYYDSERIRWLIRLISTEPQGILLDWKQFETEEPDQQYSMFWSGVLGLGLKQSVEAEPQATRLQTIINDNSLPMALRLVSVGKLRFLSSEQSIQALESLLEADQNLEIQQWAVESAFEMSRTSSAEMLTRSYRKASPSVQRLIIDHLNTRKELVLHLAAALQSGDIPAVDLDVSQRELLASRLDEPTRLKLAKLWAPVSSEPKDDLIRRYAEALHQDAKLTNSATGKTLFQQHCRTCHQRQGMATVSGRI